ncbi:hypothetical protein [Streptomyces botrytidirepellens]|uniref:hypothetical protein n=1 Tax=Streptomyces botrytidirepellens TaxID=2486417 RepID=UPI0011CDA53F|nr:hypothetical protein [Streptomyces botrytidirepellens]
MQSNTVVRNASAEQFPTSFPIRGNENTFPWRAGRSTTTSSQRLVLDVLLSNYAGSAGRPPAEANARNNEGGAVVSGMQGDLDASGGAFHVAPTRAVADLKTTIRKCQDQLGQQRPGSDRAMKREKRL